MVTWYPVGHIDTGIRPETGKLSDKTNCYFYILAAAVWGFGAHARQCQEPGQIAAGAALPNFMYLLAGAVWGSGAHARQCQEPGHGSAVTALLYVLSCRCCLRVWCACAAMPRAWPGSCWSCPTLPTRAVAPWLRTFKIWSKRGEHAVRIFGSTWDTTKYSTRIGSR